MPDFSTLKFTKHNQYESLVLPLVKWLLDQGVVFHYGTEVTDVDSNIAPGRKLAVRIYWRRDGLEGGVDLCMGSVAVMMPYATGRLRDGKEIDIPGTEFLRNLLMNKLDTTQIGALLREFDLVGGD